MWTQLRSFAERAVVASRLAAPKQSVCISRDSSASGRAVPNDALERTVIRFQAASPAAHAGVSMQPSVRQAVFKQLQSFRNHEGIAMEIVAYVANRAA